MPESHDDDVDDFDDDDDGDDDDDDDDADVDDVDGDAGDNGGWWNSGDSQCLPITVRGSRSEFSSFVLFIFVLFNFSYLFSATFHICSLQLFIFVLCKTNTSSNPVDWGNQVGQVWSIPFNEEKKVKKIYLS